MFKRTFLAATVMLCLATPTVNAASVFELFFRVDGIDGLDTTLIQTPGLVSPSEIVLRETVTNMTDPLTPLGINGINANIQATGSDGSFSAPGIVSPLVANANTADADTLGAFNFFAGINPVEISPNVFDAVVGTIDLTAPTVGATTFTLSDFSAGNDFDVLTPATIPDGDITFRSVTLQSTTAVPEPGSMATLALLGGTAAIRYRRRRKTAA